MDFTNSNPYRRSERYVKPYTLGEQIGAQFKLENTIGSAGVYLQDRTIFGFEEDPEWQAEEWLEENYKDASPEDRFRVWGAIYDSVSQGDAEQKLAVEREYQEARRIRDTMGTWTSLWTGAIAGITDPITLATLAVPVGSVANAGRGAAKIGGLVTAESTALEGILHLQQDERTLKESALNITANAILGGVVGGIGGSLKRSQFDRDEASEAIRNRCVQTIPPPQLSSLAHSLLSCIFSAFSALHSQALARPRVAAAQRRALRF